jgi:uncharacterized protein YecE (DUF72 family)
MRIKKGTLWIGTSNIVVPGNKQTYPDAYKGKSRLNYYSSFFNSIEVNSSFYKTPMPQTFEKWSLDVPEQFRFTLKLSKEVTHVKELICDLSHIDRFLEAAGRLKGKKGCLLVQFPGKISMDYFNNVEEILNRVKQNDTTDSWRIAVEFRNSTWYIGETLELIDEYNASLVMHDILKGRNGTVNKNASFVYKRLHGPTGNYRGSYTADQLQEHAFEIIKMLRLGKDVYVYFNNTMGDAFNNACTLKSMLLNSEVPLRSSGL